MQVDFYQLSRDPAEVALALIAGKVIASGERLLVVSADADLTQRIDRALWERDGFLAHGKAGAGHEARQPVLLANTVEPTNGARHVAFADGRWRDEGLTFDRAFLLFDGATIDDARATWRNLDGHEGLQRRYWRQDDGKWVQAA
ncbi:MAG: DNA polymerase III subunit chi [Sphingomonadales bacterium]|nr:DNA polymerase III subunit chi [Sphingomonadales bacterium]